MGLMRLTGSSLLAAAFWSLSVSVATSQAQPPPPAPPRRIPPAEFAARPLITQPVISPDGKRILARVNVNGKEVLGIHSLSGAPMILIGSAEDNELQWYRWAGNDRVLISNAGSAPWYGDTISVTRLHVFDMPTRSVMTLGKKTAGFEGDDLLYVDPAGSWILLAFQETIYEYPSVFRIDLATNKMEEIVKPRTDVWEWYADGDGVVRAGVGWDQRSWSMVYRKSDGEKFRKLGKAKWEDEDAALDILRFARNSDEGYVLSNKETGRYALHRFNFATKQLGEKVFESPTNDVTDFATTDDGTMLRALWYTDDRDRIVWFDEKLKKIQGELDAAVKGNEIWMISRNPDDSAMLIWTGSSNNPGAFYVFRPDEGVMHRIASVNGKLKPGELSPTKYVRYKARDGLEVPAYLTLPRGREGKNLPLIIMPHGGPYGVRDNSDYSPEVQFLANRGYAVLQPNFRGSDGYGRAFYEKGEGQWGRQMQDDLDDGMDWLVRDGVIDPKRVCIVGSSYGGYAALWGATRNPERYRCAASFAGISDLEKQLKYQVNFRISQRYRKDWRRIVQGAPDFDTKSVSPIYTIAQLKVPVLLVHGDLDQTVPYKQSKTYADALQNAGKKFEFYTFEKEGHNLSSGQNFQYWLERLDAFLAKHNPA